MYATLKKIFILLFIPCSLFAQDESATFSPLTRKWLNVYDSNNSGQTLGAPQIVAGVINQCGLITNNVAATTTFLNQMANIGIDDTGNVYVPNFTANQIVQYNPHTGKARVWAFNAYQNICNCPNPTCGGGYSGDGGPAILAESRNPTAISFDNQNNAYISDIINHVIRKVAPNGIITTYVGNGYNAGNTYGGYSGDGGQATAAELSEPSGNFWDLRDSNLYVVDQFNNAIRKVDHKTGIITTFAFGYKNGSFCQGVIPEGGYTGDGGPATAAECQEPSTICIDTAGNFYVTDSDNGVIRKINKTTNIVTTVAGNNCRGTPSCNTGCYSNGNGIATAASFNIPDCACFDANNNLYVGDYNGVIRMINLAKGTIKVVATFTCSSGSNWANGLCTSLSKDTIYWSNQNGFVLQQAVIQTNKVQFPTFKTQCIINQGLNYANATNNLNHLTRWWFFSVDSEKSALLSLANPIIQSYNYGATFVPYAHYGGVTGNTQYIITDLTPSINGSPATTNSTCFGEWLFASATETSDAVDLGSTGSSTYEILSSNYSLSPHRYTRVNDLDLSNPTSTNSNTGLLYGLRNSSSQNTLNINNTVLGTDNTSGVSLPTSTFCIFNLGAGSTYYSNAQLGSVFFGDGNLNMTSFLAMSNYMNAISGGH